MNGGTKKQPKKMSYRERQAITYQQGADPPFLAQMKKQLGYREYTVEDKFEKDGVEQTDEEGDSTLDREDIRNMPEEERPQIVVLDPSRDISSDQLQKEIDQKRDEEDKQKILEGRITFRKPEKRPTPASDEACGSREKRSKPEQDSKQRAEADRQQKNTIQQNRRLLSFGNDDEDE